MPWARIWIGRVLLFVGVTLLALGTTSLVAGATAECPSGASDCDGSVLGMIALVVLGVPGAVLLAIGWQLAAKAHDHARWYLWMKVWFVVATTATLAWSALFSYGD